MSDLDLDAGHSKFLQSALPLEPAILNDGDASYFDPNMMLGGYMDEAATNFGNSSFPKIPCLLGLDEAN